MDTPSDRETQLLSSALEIPEGAERDGFLDARCEGDPALRRRLEAMLQLEEARRRNRLERSDPLPSATSKVPVDELQGTRIGPFKLLQRIGEGGCGVVYLAEQEMPVRRRVAIKVIKLGMDTRSVIARFEAERQALAMMDHPNIAKVLEAGSTESGRPYFVMELVRGSKITVHCDQKKLSIHERLGLFLQVCDAVQHAHQKGIIHRDIKPSNILVTLHDGVTAVPKVIDFGVAKATSGVVLTDKTLFTQHEQLVGTPAYMSPEQADSSSEDIDTRADIYSLGVVLYELLTGRTPFDAQTLATSGIEAMRRTLRETEPLKPSDRLTDVAGPAGAGAGEWHAAEAPRIRSIIRGDLDWIVLKALEKDRNRRYQTPNALAADIRRHLKHELVTARPPSRTYRLQKLIQRNRLVSVVGAALVLSLIVGLGISTWQYLEKSRAYRQLVEAGALQERLRSEAESRAYASEVRLAQHALNGNNIGRARALLEGLKPGPGRADLRGWEWHYLWQQCQSAARYEFVASTDPVFGLTVSADGRILATVDSGVGEVRLWDLVDRQRIGVLTNSNSSTWAQFSPVEPVLACATTVMVGGERAHGISLWNIRTRQAERALALPGRCEGLGFSSDGRRLLTASSGTNASIQIWDVKGGVQLSAMPAQGFTVTIGTPFAVTPQLNFALQSADGGRLILYDVATRRVAWTRRLGDSGAAVDAVAISPDGRFVAAGIREKSSHIAIMAAGTGDVLSQLDVPSGYCVSLQFSADGERLCSAGSDQSVRLWSVPSGRIERILRGHRLEVWRLAWLPDHRTLVSGAKDGGVCLWDTEDSSSQPEHVRLPEKVWYTWRFTPDSQALYTADAGGRVKRWSGPAFSKAETVLEAGADIHDLTIDDRCTQVAVSHRDGSVRVWNLSTAKPRLDFTADRGGVYFWKFCRGGDGLVVVSPGSITLKEWDLVSGKLRPNPPDNRSWRMEGFCPQTRRHLNEGWRAPRPDFPSDGTVSPGGFEVPALDGALSPDGLLVAFGHHSGAVYLVDARTRTCPGPLGGFLQGVHSIAFSGDGRRLAAGGDGKEALKVWDTRTRQELVTLDADGTASFITAFSADGRWLGALNAGGDLDLWRAPMPDSGGVGSPVR